MNRDLASDFILDLWHAMPTPEKAARVTDKVIGRILKSHRIRRFDAATVRGMLRQKPPAAAPGTVEAATAHIRILTARLRLVNTQIEEIERRLDELCAAIEASLAELSNREWRSKPRRDHTPSKFSRAHRIFRDLCFIDRNPQPREVWHLDGAIGKAHRRRDQVVLVVNTGDLAGQRLGGRRHRHHA